VDDEYDIDDGDMFDIDGDDDWVPRRRSWILPSSLPPCTCGAVDASSTG
jgi:hypothetical protein